MAGWLARRNYHVVWTGLSRPALRSFSPIFALATIVMDQYSEKQYLLEKRKSSKVVLR